MKKVSTQQNQRHIRLMKKRTMREDKRKVKREIVLVAMRKINLAHKKIARAQRKMRRLAKQVSSSRAL